MFLLFLGFVICVSFVIVANNNNFKSLECFGHLRQKLVVCTVLAKALIAQIYVGRAFAKSVCWLLLI
jgi:hypothetical protein